MTTDILDRPTVDVRDRYYEAYQRTVAYAVDDHRKGYGNWALFEFRMADAIYAEYRRECRLTGTEARGA